MAQPNDSVLVTPGSGATIATHAVGGKEFQVVMMATSGGHIEGSLDSYMAVVPPHAVAANKIHFDLWNGSAANIIKVRGAWVIVAQDVANTAAVSIRLDWSRTSAVGTAGTAATYNGTATNAANITPKDSLNAALPAGVSLRDTPTGGATSAAWLFPTYHGTEELQVHAALSQWNNVLPNPERGEQELTLNPNQGLKAVQGTVVGAGNIAILLAFTVQ